MSHKKPAALHVLQGDYRKDRHGNLPVEGLAPARCPIWLSPGARRQWRRLAPTLRSLGLLTVADGDMFAVFCSLYADWRSAVERLEREGMTYLHKDLVKTNPLVGIADQLARQVISLGSHFGLTPSSRDRLDVKTPPKSALQDYLKNRHRKEQ